MLSDPSSLRDPSSRRLCCDSGAVELVVDPLAGGRIASLTVDGHDVLWRQTPEDGPFGWGSFVMAPYAGRIRLGQLDYAGAVHELPIAMAPHAIHGTTYDVAWEVAEIGATSISLGCAFGPHWPFGGSVVHHIELFDDRLEQRLEAQTQLAAPITMGWHPWFRRTLRPGGAEVQWSFDGTGVQMFERAADGSTSPALIAIPEGRVDDCFEGVGAVRVEWPGEFALTIEHDCPVVVLFDGLDHAVCVEPQTGPPDAARVWPGRCDVPVGGIQTATCTWRWA
jgi:aldose 1-epimerase